MYLGDMQASDWMAQFVSKSSSITGTLYQAEEFYKKWYAFTYGQSNAQIATALNLSINEIADMQTAAAAFNDLYGAAHNVAITQRDRETDLLKFT